MLNVLLGLIGFLVIVLFIIFILKSQSPKSQIIVGGCSGTQYGCCADGRTSKADRVGSNCLLY